MRALLLVTLLAFSNLALAGSFKIGDEAYCTNSNSTGFVRVVAIQQDGRYVVRFNSGEYTGKIGQDFTDADLARLSGSANGYTVGDFAYNIEWESYVGITGIQQNGSFVVRFHSGSNKGKIG